MSIKPLSLYNYKGVLPSYNISSIKKRQAVNNRKLCSERNRELAEQLFLQVHQKIEQAGDNDFANPKQAAAHKEIAEILKDLVHNPMYPIDIRTEATATQGMLSIKTAEPVVIKHNFNISIDNIRALNKGQPHSAIRLLEISRDLWTNFFTKPPSLMGFPLGKKKFLSEKQLSAWEQEIQTLKLKGEIRDSEYFTDLTENILVSIQDYRKQYIA